MCGDIHTIEARLLHRTGKLERSVLQHHGLLDILVHLGACSKIDGHIIEQSARLPDFNHKLGCLTCLISPVLTVRLHGHNNIITTDLGRQ